MPVKSSKSLGVPPSRKERVSNLLGSSKSEEKVVISAEISKSLLKRVKLFLIDSDEYKYQVEVIEAALKEFLDKREQD